MAPNGNTSSPMDKGVPGKHHFPHRHSGITDTHLAQHCSHCNTTKETPLAPDQNNPSAPSRRAQPTPSTRKPKKARFNGKTPTSEPPQPRQVACCSPSPPRDEHNMPSVLRTGRPATFRFRGAYLGAALTKEQIAKRTIEACHRAKHEPSVTRPSADPRSRHTGRR